MGRELKRVPMNFNWPIGKIWGGYINPYFVQSTDCDSCGGTGNSPEYKLLKDKWYGYAPFKPEDRGSIPFTEEDVLDHAKRNCNGRFNYNKEWSMKMECRRLMDLFNSSWSHHLNDDDVSALIKANRLYDFTHTVVPGKGWVKKDTPYIPTAREVNLWSINGLGHDGINCWAVIDAECKRLGYKTECDKCSGEGRIWPHPEIRNKYDSWNPLDPPFGDGFQLWQTTSEGSPCSPIFPSLDGLCAWCEDNATTFGSQKADRESWKKMLDENFVCHQENGNIFI